MVTIPDEVKALFSSDTVHKNFHVHFPGGETTDLNNENVISESVKFTESLCSQQYFKFGLAEASQIEFVAVGIPNVRGAYIECGIEIDCTRLGAAWAAAHPVDLSLPFLTPQTCQYNSKMYYRVPYGRFKIDTCPRDHGAMWQRQITAYSESIEIKSSWFPQDEVDKLPGKDAVYTPNAKALIYACAFNNNADELLNLGYSKTSTQITGGSASSVYATYSGKNSNGQTVSLKYKRVSKSSIPFNINSNAIVSFTNLATKDYVLSEFSSVLAGKGFDAEQSGFSNWDELLEDFWDSLTFNYYPYLRVSPDATGTITGPFYYPKEGDTVYLWRLRLTWMTAPTSYIDEDTNSSFCLMAPTLNIYTTSSADVIDGINLNIKSTLQTKYLNANRKFYSYENAYSTIDFIQGFLELCGWFLKPDRNGALDFFQMSLNPTPIAVSADDWESFWWDETPIESIGQVNVIYTKDNEEQQETFTIGSGNSVYTIENNEVLKAAEMDTATMESILQTYFAPNASVVNFTPVDLTMRGLPFLESGDYIELTAEDGETVDTYILSQTISGIQHLTAEITSTNGNLLEVIA